MDAERSRRGRMTAPFGRPGSVWQDLAWMLEDGRRLVRVLRRHALYSFAALLLVGGGVGANVATLGLARRALLPRLRDARADAVVSLWRRELESLGAWPGTGAHCAVGARSRWIRLTGFRAT